MGSNWSTGTGSGKSGTAKVRRVRYEVNLEDYPGF